MVLRDEKYYIDRVRAGDKEAFAWLVDQYRDMIYTVCLRMLNSEADAEEAAQDAFVKAYRSLSSFQGKSKFSTWIYRIAYNQCISVIRKKVRMIDLVEDLPDGEISEGAACVFVEGHKVPLIVRKTDGGYGYASTDMAAIKHRIEKEKADWII